MSGRYPGSSGLGSVEEGLRREGRGERGPLWTEVRGAQRSQVLIQAGVGHAGVFPDVLLKQWAKVCRPLLSCGAVPSEAYIAIRQEGGHRRRWGTT